MKSVSNQAGLYRTENSYYYRKKIPHDLREIIGVRECKKALKNGDYIAAKQTTAFLNSSLDRLFDMIRVMQPTSDDIKFLIRNYFERLLMDAEGQLWLDSEVWRGWEKEDHDGATPDQRIEQLQYGLTFVKEIAKQQGHHERFLELAKELMAWKGFTFNEMSPSCTQLCRGMMDAELEARRIELAVRLGEMENADIRHPLFKDCRNFMIDPDIDLLIANEHTPYYEHKSQGHALKDVVKRYIDFIRQKNYAGNTLQDIENTLMLMAEAMGDKRLLTAVSNDDCRAFRDLILKMPAHYGKKYKPKGMSIMDVINSDQPYDTLSPRSQDKYWQWVKAFFTWCVDEGYLRDNPVGKIKVLASKPSINDRDVFTDDELKCFFISPQYTGHKSESRRTDKGDMIFKDGKYWIPLIALFTGMRLGEIIQLQIGDVRYDGDVAYLDVNTDADFKSVKTEQSRRVIPVHPELVKIGLLDMVEKARTARGDKDRLFHDIKISESRGVSHEFSKYFARYMTGINLKRDKLTFHSFRHNFVQGMRDARLETERMDALDGRITGFGDGAQTRRNYGRSFTAKDLHPDVCKIVFNVDLSHLQTQ